ncbi:MAG: DUF433 domain-containing protein [Bacteroidota bacterium]
MNWRDYIVSDPDVIGGKPRVKGTRLGVAFLLELFAAGWTQDDILSSYPHLKSDDLRAVFAFAAETSEAEKVFALRRSAP